MYSYETGGYKLESDLVNNRAASQLRARKRGGGPSLVRLGLDFHDCLGREDRGRERVTCDT